MNYFSSLFFGLVFSVSMFCNFAFSSEASQTLADIKFQVIIDAQNKLFEQLQQNSDNINDIDRDKRLESLFRDYELFITKNSDYIQADILYGKLLRQVGLTKKAQGVFLAANKKDSSVAVIKQQIGNYFAEQGEFPLALTFFLEAIHLEPLVAIYHYQVGELLYRFKSSFLEKGIFTADKIDQQMLSAFRQAAQLESNSWIYQVRYAEAFYDLSSPSWAEAFNLWKKLEPLAPSIEERELVLLNEARIQIKLKHFEQAKRNLAQVYSVSFEKSRRDLLELIPKFNSQFYFN